jgi:hypothetical protein
MGNHNSGPRGRSSGISVEACEVIDASRWSRAGMIRKGIEKLQLTSTSPNGEQLEYPVFLAETRPYFGGSRWWFQCPLCRRRVQKLFLPPRGKTFGCRDCHRLTYNSRKECPDGRYWSTLQKIYTQLGGDVYSASGFPPRPKGMWLRTYQRLKAKAANLPQVRLWRVLRRRAAHPARLSKRSLRN